VRNEQEWIDALISLPKHPFKWAVGRFTDADLKAWETVDRLNAAVRKLNVHETFMYYHTSRQTVGLVDTAVRRLKELFVSAAGARTITSLPALVGQTFHFDDVDGNVAAANGEVTFIATAPTLITMRITPCNGHTWEDWMRVAKDVAEALDTDVVIE
jgi:hypothetical protein